MSQLQTLRIAVTAQEGSFKHSLADWMERQGMRTHVRMDGGWCQEPAPHVAF
jgi:hypothetical protein